MPGPSPKISGPAKSEGEEVGHSGETTQALTPQPSYEPTGAYPSQPEWGGRARFTRATTGPTWTENTGEGDVAPYSKGPTRRNKPDLKGP